MGKRQDETPQRLAPLAQLAEQLTLNRLHSGSPETLPTPNVPETPPKVPYRPTIGPTTREREMREAA
jgi:hypothetical protein